MSGEAGDLSVSLRLFLDLQPFGLLYFLCVLQTVCLSLTQSLLAVSCSVSVNLYNSLVCLSLFLPSLFLPLWVFAPVALFPLVLYFLCLSHLPTSFPISSPSLFNSHSPLPIVCVSFPPSSIPLPRFSSHNIIYFTHTPPSPKSHFVHAEQVAVDEVPGVAGVQGFTVLLHTAASEDTDFLQVFVDLPV